MIYDEKRLKKLKSIIEIQTHDEKYYGEPVNVILNSEDVNWFLKHSEILHDIKKDTLPSPTCSECNAKIDRLISKNSRLEELKKQYVDIIDELISSIYEYVPEHFDTYDKAEYVDDLMEQLKMK